MTLTSDLWSESLTLTFDLGQDVPRRINWVVSEDLISNRISTCLSYIVPHYDLITNPDWFLWDLVTPFLRTHIGLIVFRSDRA